MTFKPMLAVEYNPEKLAYPVFASPKIDGIRGSVVDGKLLSRSLKPIPNEHVAALLSLPELEGFDGELVAGSPTSPSAMQEAMSLFMSRDKVLPFTWFVFDLHNLDEPYTARYKKLIERAMPKAHVVVLEQTLIYNERELAEYEAEQIAEGYEGVILRDPQGLYKYGRSTVNSGQLLKVKRFTDAEAVVIGFEEQMYNANLKVVNELGHGQRSTHMENLHGKGTLGALVVRDIATGVQFNVGTGLGLDIALRSHIWDNRPAHFGKIIKYKSFPFGVKIAPRHPVFLGFRSELDMGEAA